MASTHSCGANVGSWGMDSNNHQHLALGMTELSGFMFLAFAFTPLAFALAFAFA